MGSCLVWAGVARVSGEPPAAAEAAQAIRYRSPIQATTARTAYDMHAICVLATRLQAAAPAVVWEAEFYLEIRWSTQAIIEYLNYFAQQRQPLPVSLYFGVIELIETSGESERWQRSLRDALGRTPRPRIGGQSSQSGSARRARE